jgi:hypothetical protein
MDRAATDGTAHEVQTCHLLRLPCELRNRIYEEVCGIDPSSTYLLRFYHKKLCPEQPTLLRTCRQIRHEALAVFYGRVRYLIDDLGPLFRQAHYVFKYLRPVKLQINCIIPSHGLHKQVGCTLEAWHTTSRSLVVASTLEYISGYGPYCACELTALAREAEARGRRESKNALLLFCGALRLRRTTLVHKPGEPREVWERIGPNLKKRMIKCGMGEGESKEG